MSVKVDIKSDARIVPERSSEYDFFAHANAFSEDDIILTNIGAFSSSYSDHRSIEAYTKRLPKIIADVQVCTAQNPPVN